MKKYDFIIGCDPGKSGGISIININNNDVSIFDMPTSKINKGTKKKPKYKNELNEIEIVNLFKKYYNKKVLFGLERVSSMPGEGSVSSFSFGMGWGFIKGVVRSFEFDLEIISPVTWKKGYPNLENKEILKLKIDRDDIKENLKDNLFNIEFDDSLTKNKKIKYKKELKKEKKKEIDKINRNIKTIAKRLAREEAAKISSKNIDKFKRSKDDGRAESLLIANYLKNEVNKTI